MYGGLTSDGKAKWGRFQITMDPVYASAQIILSEDRSVISATRAKNPEQIYPQSLQQRPAGGWYMYICTCDPAFSAHTLDKAVSANKAK